MKEAAPLLSLAAGMWLLFACPSRVMAQELSPPAVASLSLGMPALALDGDAWSERREDFYPQPQAPLGDAEQRARARSVARSGWALTALGLVTSIITPVVMCSTQDPNYYQCREATGFIVVNVAMLFTGVAMGVTGTIRGRRLDAEGVMPAELTPRERRRRAGGWVTFILMASAWILGNTVVLLSSYST